ncbi:hypothetical protein GCM10020220_102720 [Nonomuraea rubra]|uniref:hypothetical protein n=1 Tax=Nonomuraea rubra TaxID=46180 RepID=UPI0031E9B281
MLLATPTWMSGHLDPDVLVDRLETCAAAEVEPPPADLAQALLRLPRGRHPAAADRAAKVDSEAARSAARWLAGDGLADPGCGPRVAAHGGRVHGRLRRRGAGTTSPRSDCSRSCG